MGKNERKAVSLSTFICIIFLVIAIMLIGFYFFYQYKTDEIKKKNDAMPKASSENENKVNDSELLDQDDDSYIMLYDGCTIEKKTGIQSIPAYMEATDENKSKYEITYYTYDKNGTSEEIKGKFKEDEAYEGYGYVSNVKKIATSLKYDVMPRKYEDVKSWQKIEAFKEFLDVSDVKVESIDLDGDEKTEYIVVLNNFTSKDNYDIEKSEAFTQILLFDSEYNKVASLVSWNNETEENNKDSYVTADNITYADINNDGVMEILIELPEYEGGALATYEYNEGSILGNTNYQVDVSP